MTDIERMKIILRENEAPFFADDSELQFYIDENNGDVDKAIYQCLILKSENSVISVSGMSSQDTSSYFKRLAQKYRPNNSGVLRGV